ncbi:thioredoxin-like [Carcharodon carcharias]|uniref:thioredoxin-like n=1 Tax=Carcharodon carcharias TaxID=13397 RepID=UPI001B7E70B6|nr:thioredoxin-like [Carcharodon carcharias]
MVCHIENLADFQAKLKEAGDKLVLIDFFADWCGPCKQIAPKFEALSKQHTNVIFYKVNVEEAEDVATECQISAMPTFHFYKNGKKVTEVVGANVDQLEKNIKELQ